MRSAKSFISHSSAWALGLVLLNPACAFVRPYDEGLEFSDAPADLGGEAWTTHADWKIASQAEDQAQTLRLIYEVGEQGIVEGGSLALHLGHVLPTDQRLYVPFSLSAVSVYFFRIQMLRDVKVGTTNPNVRLKIREPKPKHARRHFIRYIKWKRSKAGEAQRDNFLRHADNEFAIRIELSEGQLEPGDQIHIDIGKPSKMTLTPPTREAQMQFIVRVDGDGDGVYGVLDELPVFEAYSDAVAQATLVAPSTMVVGESGTATLRIEDDYFLPNLARFESAQLELEPEQGLSLPLERSIEGSLESWKGCVTDIPIRAQAPGLYRVRGRVKVDGVELELRSNPIEVLEAAAVEDGTLHTYFGDTHLHSILSYDADRPPSYVYERQRDRERHDFALLSDHDMIGAVPFASKVGVAGRDASEWAYARELADRYNESGRFVTLYAYEWTSYYYGHRNIYFAPHEHDPPLIHHNQDSRYGKPDELAPLELQELLEGHDYIAIPHSTAWPTGAKNFYWGPDPDDPRGDPQGWPEQRLLELYSTHGASEYYDNEHAVDQGRPEAPTDSKLIKKLTSYDIRQAEEDSGNFAQDALAAGWRFGFVGSSDMHFLSHIDQAYKYGFAGVKASELSREALWEALEARRTYATTGVRILLDFEVGGAQMGSVIPAQDGPLELRAAIHGTEELDVVEIIRFDGEAWEVAHRVEPEGMDCELKHEEPAAAPGSLYYLRVRQAGGDYAWSSPVWIEG